MRVLAIGDIHGQSTALAALLEAVQPESADIVVTLGDYVDGGPDSASVLDMLIELHRTANHVALRGNHDQMMLDARVDESDLDLWLTLGGEKTLSSYPGGELPSVPEAHWLFLERSCVDSYETDTHIFVHAHLEPDLPVDQQPTKALHWRSLNLAAPHCSGKTVICGHTPQESGLPANHGHTICLDTAEWLTCLEISSGQLWQTNDEGQCRRSNLQQS